jgi:hypothetical protein
LGFSLQILHAPTEGEFDGVFAGLNQMRASGLVIAVESFFTARREQLAELALRHRIPAVYQSRDFAAAGGVMSYGGSLAEGFRLVEVYTARVLKGEKPADLPVLQVTKVELIVNLKIAKSFGRSPSPCLAVQTSSSSSVHVGVWQIAAGSKSLISCRYWGPPDMDGQATRFDPDAFDPIADMCCVLASTVEGGLLPSSSQE